MYILVIMLQYTVWLHGGWRFVLLRQNRRIQSGRREINVARRSYKQQQSGLLVFMTTPKFSFLEQFKEFQYWFSQFVLLEGIVCVYVFANRNSQRIHIFYFYLIFQVEINIISTISIGKKREICCTHFDILDTNLPLMLKFRNCFKYQLGMVVHVQGFYNKQIICKNSQLCIIYWQHFVQISQKIQQNLVLFQQNFVSISNSKFILQQVQCPFFCYIHQLLPNFVAFNFNQLILKWVNNVYWKYASFQQKVNQCCSNNKNYSYYFLCFGML
eukprot:TRINITY_DN8499_c0_g1_i1.p2 TRINITY_DN8499_c0_g1~~TRINITY_DN8499_c0_g1_i1.p2  ORF type:complete len:271 (-),score=-18.43 TRINITY_DN8499_c0_g1_i1:117-929(-)